MGAYWAMFSSRFRLLLQYRAAALAGLATQVFWGMVRMMVFAAFYRSAPAGQPMSFPDVVTYIWLGQALLLMIPFRLDGDIRMMIRTGNVAYELLKPVDLYWLWYSRGISLRSAPVLLRAVPMVIIALLCFGMGLPASPASGFAWLAATGMALLLSAAIGTLIVISMMWTVSGDGIMRIAPALVFFMSGIVIPLPFFPDWLQPVIRFLPFRGLMDVPFRLYTGHIPAADVWGLMAHQLAWTVALIILGRFLLSRGMKRLVAQGG